MSIIINRIKLAGSKGEKKVDALFDSGATYSFIRKELALRLAIPDNLPNPLEFETAGEGDKLSVKEAVRLDFYIEGIRLSDDFLIIEELSEDVIIGATTLQKWRLKLDFDQDRVIVNQMVTRLIFK